MKTYRFTEILKELDSLPIEVKETLVHYMSKDINRERMLRTNVEAVNAEADALELPMEVLTEGRRKRDPNSWTAIIGAYLSEHKQATKKELAIYAAAKKNSTYAKGTSNVENYIFNYRNKTITKEYTGASSVLRWIEN